MRKIIRVDGTEESLDGPVTVTRIRELIGATSIDTVNLRHMGTPLHVMCVDDHGHVTQPVQEGVTLHLRSIGHRKPVNQKATELYWANCRPGTTHQIVGDVVIVPDEDFA